MPTLPFLDDLRVQVDIDPLDSAPTKSQVLHAAVAVVVADRVREGQRDARVPRRAGDEDVVNVEARAERGEPCQPTAQLRLAAEGTRERVVARKGELDVVIGQGHDQ